MTLQQWLSPPAFSDDEDNRVARLLNLILVTANALSLILIVIIFLLTPSQITFIVALLLLMAAYSAGLLALRRKWQPQHVAKAIVGVFWLASLLVTILSGGVSATAYNGQIVVILIAALLLKRRDVILFTLLSMVSGLALVELELSGLSVTPLIFETPLLTWSLQVIFLVMTGLLLSLAVQHFNALLHQSRAQEQILAQRNTQLKAEVTRRKQAEHEMRRQADLLEQVSDAVISTDMNGIVQSWNRAAERIYGWTAVEVIGHPLVNLLKTRFLDDSLERSLQIIQQSGHWWGEVEQQRKESSPVTIFASVALTYDMEGKPASMVAVNRDVTALRAGEHRLKLAMKGARMATWDWNLATDENNWDEAAHELFGIENRAFEKTIGAFAARVAPEDRETVARMLEVCRETGAPFDAEYRVRHADGQTRWLHSLGHMTHFDDAGKPIYMVGIVRDITERKQAEQEHLELALERERVQLFKDFLHTVSHDLKTPIGAIGATLYLLERASDPAERQSRTQVIKEQLVVLDKMIQDILTMARLDHTPRLNVKPISLNHIIEAVAQSLRASAEKKRIDLQLNLEAANHPVAADETEIQRAMTNLIENALNYTPEGGRVAVRAYDWQDSATIEVTDTGIGINPDDLPHIFERFFRSTQARSFTSGGTGLGLAIVKQILDLHHGQIEVESQPGQGTLFRIKLPL